MARKHNFKKNVYLLIFFK